MTYSKPAEMYHDALFISGIAHVAVKLPGYNSPLRVDSCRYIGNFCERTSETLVDVHSPARPISSRVGIVQSEALRS
jgi:hypothetical protein